MKAMRRLILVLVTIFLGYSAPASAAELLMFRTAGCPWCAAWDRQIAPAYPNTEFGRRAPVRFVDMDRREPPGATLRSPPRFSPTFVLVDAGREVGRIEGYPGEDFFWGLLEKLIAQLPPAEPSHVTAPPTSTDTRAAAIP
jgi:hypothetical protein